MPRIRTARRLVSPAKEWIDMRARNLVKTALSLPSSSDRVLLFFWAGSDEPRFENVARLDKQGNVIWRVPLPDSGRRDCFISLAADRGCFVARTYTGLVIAFDADGRLREGGPTARAA